jgi:lipid A 3-O-deacylase
MSKPRGNWGWRLAAGLLVMGSVTVASAQSPPATPSGPLGTAGEGAPRGEGWFDAFFFQRGTGEEVEAFTIGVMRHLPVSWLGERANLYGELSLSRWEARPHAPSDTGTLVQLGLKPVLRYVLINGSVPTFAEFGIGLTVTSEPYRKSERRFSSTFNFGDHLAIGWAFGARREHELVLRVEHFSNGNIKLPNPGENFREVRYVHWF